MEYMLLIHSDDNAFEALPQDVQMQALAAYGAYSQALQEAGILPQSSTPQALRQFVEKETAKWREVGKTVKLDPIR